MKLVHQELVRMLCLNTPLREPIGRKVLQVRRDDEIGPAADGGRQYVPIVGIGKVKALD